MFVLAVSPTKEGAQGLQKGLKKPWGLKGSQALKVSESELNILEITHIKSALCVFLSVHTYMCH